MLSSTLIWSLFPEDVKVEVELPNMGELAEKGDDGETEVPAEAVVNEKPRPGEAALVEPKTTGAVLPAEKEGDDAPKEKTGELVMAPKGEEFGVCQLDPNETAAPPLELAALVSEDRDGVLAPKMAEPVPVLELIMPVPEDELAPKLKMAGGVLLLETGALGNEDVTEELIPKLNVLLEVPLLMLNALTPEEAAEAPVPKLNRPDGPLPQSTDLVSTEEVEVRPKLAPEPNNLSAAGAEELNIGLLDVKDETPELQKTEGDADEPN